MSFVRLLAISLRLGIKLLQSSPVLLLARLMLSRIPTNFFSLEVSILGVIILIEYTFWIAFFVCGVIWMSGLLYLAQRFGLHDVALHVFIFKIANSDSRNKVSKIDISAMV